MQRMTITRQVLITVLMTGLVGMLAATLMVNLARADETLNLLEENNSGVHGTVSLTAKGNQTEVIIQVNQQADGAKPMPAHIHTGRCNQNPQVTYPLNPVTNHTSTTLVNAPLSEIQSVLRSVQVHRSAEEINIYVACADVQQMSQLPSTGETGNLQQLLLIALPAIFGLAVVLRLAAQRVNA